MNTTESADGRAIKNVLADQYQAWAAGDASAFVADYSEDATVIMPGSYRRNRGEIHRSMTDGFATFLKDTNVTDEVESIRFLGDDHAIVISTAGILFPGATEVPENQLVHATWVFHRVDGRWLVESYHNSPVHPS